MTKALYEDISKIINEEREPHKDDRPNDPLVIIWDGSKSSYDGQGIVGMMNLSAGLRIYARKQAGLLRSFIDQLSKLKPGERMKIGSKWFQLRRIN